MNLRRSPSPTAPAGRAHPAAPVSAADEARGLWLGFVGVAMFAMTMPMTRLAVGPAEAPQLSPLFVTAGRAAVAGLLSVAYLIVMRARRPSAAEWRMLALISIALVYGFPGLAALALREVEATHAAVVTGVLPIGTAVVGAIVLRQRGSAGFWAAALLGLALVLAFAWQAGGGWRAADSLLLAAVLAGAIGYVGGARLAVAMPPQQVICWVLVLALPTTLPLALRDWPAGGAASVQLSSWLAFGYLSLFSMWIGFFAWYRGLALGGTLRVSQVQLLQPFLGLLAAVPLLGERLDAATLLFALAVMATVLVSRRMPVCVSAGAAR